MLSANDLEWYAARLAIAVYDTNRESEEMSVQSLKAALHDVDGSKELTVTYASNGNRLVHIGDKVLEIGPMASNDEIKLALQNPFVRTENTKVMSVTGIQSGAFQAKLAEMRAKMAAKQTAALAQIDAAVTAGGAQMDEATKGVTDKVDAEIAAALHEFAQTTNGGPA